MQAVPERLSHEYLTTVRMRSAAEAHDVEGVVANLAEDAVLRSPVTDRILFRGRRSRGGTPCRVRDVERRVLALQRPAPVLGATQATRTS
jgi:hypothetical protein